MERNANAYYDLQSHAFELLKERIAYEDIQDASDAGDAIHEVAGDVTPHYYHEIFTVMAADGIDIDFEDSGLIPETKDVSRICQARIYEQLTIDMWNNVDQIVDEYLETLEDTSDSVVFDHAAAEDCE
ncbi:overcome classical restriction [Salmonella phage STP-SP1]|uniref:Overcome classical restriction n=1 Tax=Salmonella phage PRF-SP1 TaxID=2873462 RepID=A0AAE9BPN7_9CAUD|nr:overcome classical restriction [Salmonella phage PRF-SP1]UFZ20921.1 overcome classical restriction [Salmonella phage PRF-SP3]UIS44205.1 overcome classical restriction [Salmonella phage PRF-SP4]UIS44265.1 overcome classical restriction [Salmonella phage PRF-SP5]UOL48299.1 overcome classical restriction [Salmonella phage PRF-SP2]WNO24885.1 overcome classical restriction [Salmonella phage PRF-SP11]WOZ56357.1 overcome classical restriction [Salmonella phage PRF-SP9]WOZ56454.1 overcome classic